MLGKIFAILLGLLPGGLLIVAGNTRPGIAVLGLGGLAGVLYAVGGVSPQRILRLLAASLVAKNIPIVGNRAFDRVDRVSDASLPVAQNKDWLLQWLVPSTNGRGIRWRVLTGLLLGAAMGVGVGIHDLIYAQPFGGWVLPMKGVKDPLIAQACLLTLGSAIWGATTGGFCTSTVYRRSLVGASLFCIVWSACIGYAASQFSRVSMFSLVIFFTTGGLAVAVVWGWIIDTNESGTDAN